MFEAAVNFASYDYPVQSPHFSPWRRIRPRSNDSPNYTKACVSLAHCFCITTAPKFAVDRGARVDRSALTRAAAGFPHALLSGLFLFWRASFLFFVVTLTE
jgi:hypothetical protein